mgnify:CR=1 FL=1
MGTVIIVYVSSDDVSVAAATFLFVPTTYGTVTAARVRTVYSIFVLNLILFPEGTACAITTPPVPAVSTKYFSSGLKPWPSKVACAITLFRPTRFGTIVS